MLRQFPHILLLSFALLFAQQAAFAHALSHLGHVNSQSQKDKKSPHNEQCIKCTVFSQIGAACHASAHKLPLLPRAQECVAIVATQTSVSPRPAYHSRAPPCPV